MQKRETQPLPVGPNHNSSLLDYSSVSGTGQIQQHSLLFVGNSSHQLVKTMPPRQSIRLRDEEIEELYRDFDHDQDGKISFQELEKVLKDVYDELAPDPQRHHLTHPERSQNNSKADSRKKHVHDEKATPQGTHHDSDLHDFLCKLMPGCGDTMSKEDFFKQVRSWNVPSQDQTGSEHDNNDAKDYDRKLSRRRRLLAWWSVKGPEVAFLVFVGALILAFSLWQGLIYATSGEARAALGGGVVAAKFSAGAVYPTFFFLILSMSRWFATFCRKSYLVSRFINWDLSQSFHIWMSCLALVFSLTHVIGHLSGTFVYGSSSSRQQNLQRYLGSGYVHRSYSDYMYVRLSTYKTRATLMTCVQRISSRLEWSHSDNQLPYHSFNEYSHFPQEALRDLPAGTLAYVPYAFVL
jgi:hypothetical protein